MQRAGSNGNGRSPRADYLEPPTLEDVEPTEDTRIVNSWLRELLASIRTLLCVGDAL